MIEELVVEQSTINRISRNIYPWYIYDTKSTTTTSWEDIYYFYYYYLLMMAMTINFTVIFINMMMVVEYVANYTKADTFITKLNNE